MKKKVLITGITGFVGSHLADYILSLNDKDIEIHGTRRWRSPLENIEHMMEKLQLHYCELLDAKSVQDLVAAVRPDIIFHLAAQSYVMTSFSAPVNTIETNICGTVNLLEAVRYAKIDPVIHICSSSEVYGQVRENEVPIKESQPFRPASPYAVSKVGEDMLASQYGLSYGLRIICTRMFTHTGPRRGEVFVTSAFARQIARVEAGIQEPVLKVGNLESIRTFADVRDTVRAYWLLVHKCKPGEVYNIGGSVSMTVGEMLNKLLSMTDKKISIKVDPALLRPSDVTLQIPDCTKFKQETGWEPEIPFEKTLKDLLDFWRDHYAARKKRA
ncbi:MAG: GDP-mannose 4,6-dehydratase [Candidatus Omnitrophica bacterium]|nr:GDP-mannose 4,6-dehydratase [Candidatus Omnitrophota bacterium]MDD5138238.1 GDP-mannose 4,6-dehydratase [Candidatus Omnitrophota bacterium]